MAEGGLVSLRLEAMVCNHLGHEAMRRCRLFKHSDDVPHEAAGEAGVEYFWASCGRRACVVRVVGRPNSFRVSHAPDCPIVKPSKWEISGYESPVLQVFGHGRIRR